MNNATMGAAVLGGYLLGRTKKAKIALGLSALLAGSRVRPGQLGKALDAPFLGDLTRQVRAELTGAGKAAATSVLSSKADNLAGALHERTAGLRERAEGDGGAHDDETEDEPTDETEEETPEDEAEDETEDETADEPTDESKDEEPEEESKDDEPEDKSRDEGEGQGKRTGKAGGSGAGSRRRSAPQSRGTARPKKKTAAASRAKSSSGTRSRRQDDG